MTVILYAKEESETVKDTVGWETKLEVSGDVNASEQTNYKIFVYCEITGSNTNRQVAVRVLVDGVERTFDSYEPPTSDLYKACCFMGLMSLIGEHTLTLQFTPVNIPQTAKIRRARILLEKH